MEWLALLVLVLVVLAIAMRWRVSQKLPGSRRDDSALLRDEDVQFTVYRPQQVEPERWYPLLAFAHHGAPVEQDGVVVTPAVEVQRQAQALLQDRLEAYRPVTTDGMRAVPRSGELALVPEMEGVEFNPDRATFRWEQAVHRADFQLKVIGGGIPRTARGRLTVWNGPFLVADIPLTIQVVQHAAGVQMAAGEPGRRYRHIFASYSHDDSEVVQQFEAFVETLGDRYARDVRDLRSGQVWSDEIRALIERADVFQLFWSWNALSSSYVKQEWEYALGLKREGFVRPVYWEDPLPSRGELPPERLRRLHFHRLKNFVRPPRTLGPPRGSRPPTPARPSRVSSSRPLLAALAIVLTAGISVPLYFATRTVMEPPDAGTGAPAPTENPPILTPPVKQAIVFDDVYFAAGQARLSDEARANLDEVAAQLKKDSDLRLTLVGHTAATGAAETNLALGERRAAAARDYLVAQGIDPRRLRIVSYGEERPKHDNALPETRRLNDRVTYEVAPPNQP